MSEFVVSTPPLFRPMPGHNPRNREDRYRRVRYYTAQLGSQASAQLKQALLVLRNNADQMPTPELQAMARKQYTEVEFLSAVKELMCMWIHLEAVDQGGEGMPSWLMSYLKLALFATDYMIEKPGSMEIMTMHAHCTELADLHTESAKTVAAYLGFGASSEILGKAFVPLLTNSRAMRQKLLRESLIRVFDDEGFEF